VRSASLDDLLPDRWLTNHPMSTLADWFLWGRPEPLTGGLEAPSPYPDTLRQSSRQG